MTWFGKYWYQKGDPDLGSPFFVEWASLDGMNCTLITQIKQILTDKAKLIN